MKLSLKTRLEKIILIAYLKVIYGKKHKINEVTELGKPKGNKPPSWVLMYLGIKYHGVSYYLKANLRKYRCSFFENLKSKPSIVISTF